MNPTKCWIAPFEKVDFPLQARTLIFGIGNPGRQDDALGIRFVEALEKSLMMESESFSFECNYQLNIEDALTISRYDRVLFVDADKSGTEIWRVEPVIPDRSISFSTHAMSMGSVLALCMEIYDRNPEVSVLRLPGFSWEIGIGLSKAAEEKLNQAVDFFSKRIQSSAKICDKSMVNIQLDSAF